MTEPTEPEPHARTDDTVLVFTGGELMTTAPGPLPAAGYVIAADSGLDQARHLGYAVDLVLGDFDSVTPDALAAAEQAGATVERHPAAKDATDLELALDAAVARHPRRVVVVGGHGGRVDHFLSGVLALTRDATAGVDMSAFVGPARAYVVRDRLAVEGRPGELVTLLAVRGPVTGVSTEGLLYPLHGETLEPGSTRGVSNEMTGRTAVVTVETGVLLAVLPGELGTHVLGSTDTPSTP